jgi:hypothetical protein
LSLGSSYSHLFGLLSQKIQWTAVRLADADTL